MAGLGNRRRLCIGHFTANARCTLHEPHPLDGLAVLDRGLDQSRTFPCYKAQ